MLHYSGPLGQFASKVEVALQEKVLAFAREPVPSHPGGGVPVETSCGACCESERGGRDLLPQVRRLIHRSKPPADRNAGMPIRKQRGEPRRRVILRSRMR
jgi:hypothetical protein